VVGSNIYPWIIRNGFPAGFRVLCHNCNIALARYGVCPHQSAELPSKPFRAKHKEVEVPIPEGNGAPSQFIVELVPKRIYDDAGGEVVQRAAYVRSWATGRPRLAAFFGATDSLVLRSAADWFAGEGNKK
jgi:hypothetical protein